MTMPADEQVSPRMIYQLARYYDEWPDENYEGSSCRAAVDQVAHAQHHPETAASGTGTGKTSIANSASRASTANGEQLDQMDRHMKSMREMHEAMKAAKTPEERQRLMGGHMQAMQNGMQMMNGMMAGQSADKATMSPQMMQKQMEMMQMEMQMMMDRMGPHGTGSETGK